MTNRRSASRVVPLSAIASSLPASVGYRFTGRSGVSRSLKLGWVTASLLISRLQASPRQTALTRALQEHGRIAKTLHILRYLESDDYRRRINRQLNKGESLHALRRFLFFAHEGHVRRREPDDQADQAACLTLLTNAVVV